MFNHGSMPTSCCQKAILDYEKNKTICRRVILLAHGKPGLAPSKHDLDLRKKFIAFREEIIVIIPCNFVFNFLCIDKQRQK